MFVVFLKFSANKAAAPDHMEDHKAWIKHGFDEGVFLVVGSLQPNRGGAILAHNTTLEDLEARVADDPFVVADVATPEIAEISPVRADERLSFLVD